MIYLNRMLNDASLIEAMIVKESRTDHEKLGDTAFFSRVGGEFTFTIKSTLEKSKSYCS